MSIIRLSNGGSLIEERHAFPDPEIVVRTVFRFDDIKYLKTRSPGDIASLVYFYDDRDYLNNLTHYTGETKNSPLSRYTTTHARTTWLNSIRYPLIGAAESLMNPWDTDTRKTIEALCAYKMKTLGFDVVNKDNQDWSHGVIIPATVNGAYADSVAKIVVEHQIALLGLSGIDIKALAIQLGVQQDDNGITTMDENCTETIFNFPHPERLRAEEKFEALIRLGKITVGEPLHVAHRLVHKSVTLRSSSTVEYKNASYKPRDALKAIAHEIFTDGVTTKQNEGWGGYDPLKCFTVERDNNKIRLETLWIDIKEQVLGSIIEQPNMVDEEWNELVQTNNLQGSTLTCNTQTATINNLSEIIHNNNTYYSLTEFGEAVNGLNENGWGNFTIHHNNETYTINNNT